MYSTSGKLPAIRPECFQKDDQPWKFSIPKMKQIRKEKGFLGLEDVKMLLSEEFSQRGLQDELAKFIRLESVDTSTAERLELQLAEKSNKAYCLIKSLLDRGEEVEFVWRNLHDEDQPEMQKMLRLYDLYRNPMPASRGERMLREVKEGSLIIEKAKVKTIETSPAGCLVHLAKISREGREEKYEAKMSLVINASRRVEDVDSCALLENLISNGFAKIDSSKALVLDANNAVLPCDEKFSNTIFVLGEPSRFRDRSPGQKRIRGRFYTCSTDTILKEAEKMARVIIGGRKNKRVLKLPECVLGEDGIKMKYSPHLRSRNSNASTLDKINVCGR